MNTKRCPVCKDEFVSYPSREKKGKSKYCSMDCYKRFRSERKRDCSHCHRHKNLREDGMCHKCHWYFDVFKEKGRTPAQKERIRLYNLDYQKNNRDKVNALFNKYRREKSLFVKDVKAKIGCIDCGVKDPEILDFDHVSGEKKFTVAHMISKRYSQMRIKEEMAKCEVRCANCHRLKTQERRKQQLALEQLLAP